MVLVCGTLVYTKGDEEEASIEVSLLASAVGTEGAGTPPPEPAAADAAADPEPGAASGATDPRMPTMPIARLAAAGGASTQPIGVALSLKVGALWSWTPAHYSDSWATRRNKNAHGRSCLLRLFSWRLAAPYTP